MIRIFLPPDTLSTDKITITGDQARHLSVVLRTAPSDHLIIFDGTGFKYTCNVLEVHKKEVIVEKIKKEFHSAESPLSITLAQGLPKSDKMDLIVQKSTELGVTQIIPLITERSQIRHTGKVERWQKIALSASQQCGRAQIPVIAYPISMEHYLREHLPVEQFPQAHIIFSEAYSGNHLKEILTGFKGVGAISLLVGPEGGFSKEEITSAVKKGFIEASLGPRILRTETAPITAISIIQYELGDIG
ncbi:MAG: 16S rRNA (uracil(1498)-N(3))-methyltransferase [Nitrospiraceae bacterium]|nr:MAG: 16S rRNA (uracil(1498)-N(3))-methyltransferase [Nitrospiraceae bacterium]